jgi:hypothetical protein
MNHAKKHPGEWVVVLNRATPASQYHWTLINPQGGSFGSNDRSTLTGIVARTTRNLEPGHALLALQLRGQQTRQARALD